MSPLEILIVALAVGFFLFAVIVTVGKEFSSKEKPQASEVDPQWKTSLHEAFRVKAE
jgi:hypothetical protein